MDNFSITSWKEEFFSSFVIPAPKRVRDKLQQEPRLISSYYWIPPGLDPEFAGMT